MLVLLQILHIFWFYLIAAMIVRLVTGDADKLTDTREVEADAKRKKAAKAKAAKAAKSKKKN
jgi:hypothetical protein